MDFNFSKDIFLENERALIRPLLLTDYENLLAIATADEKLIQFSPSQIHSPALLKEYINSAISDRQNKIRYSFILFDKQLNKFAGSSSFGNLSNKDKRIEIGWTWIGKPFQQTGFNRSCKFLLLGYAFDTLGFERVELRTDERNIQSRTAIEKIGGKFEGTLRSHMLMNDGFRRNTVCYSILKDEWNGLKENFLRNN